MNITTKFNLDDTAYRIKDNKIDEVTIETIEIDIDTQGNQFGNNSRTTIAYKIVTDGENFPISESRLFASPEELCKALLEIVNGQ